jgi:hypothetical protein
MKYLSSILSGMVFLHALLTAPLLVQCIPVDGRYLIEILGNDPCRPQHEEDKLSSLRWLHTTTVASSDSKTDPCTDLTFDSLYDRSICSDLLVQVPQAHEQIARMHHDGARIVLRAETLRPGPGPVVLKSHTAPFPSALRI